MKKRKPRRQEVSRQVTQAKTLQEAIKTLALRIPLQTRTTMPPARRVTEQQRTKKAIQVEMTTTNQGTIKQQSSKRKASRKPAQKEKTPFLQVVLGRPLLKTTPLVINRTLLYAVRYRRRAGETLIIFTRFKTTCDQRTHQETPKPITSPTNQLKQLRRGLTTIQVDQ
ncbi:unnamed protein product [Trichogramma brassicae]|uniref:Uncharacterized protein n=1 Tax=Trichogramma brassicae TaxID=86971 RepID=A0A6H5IRY5_9HYME|nr:unnamed protein product [Trichogramma brassicae]